MVEPVSRNRCGEGVQNGAAAAAKRRLIRPALLLVLVLSGAAFAVPEGLTFRDLDLHPDLLFQPYLSGAAIADAASPAANRIQAFRELLAQYEQRQGVDDNFTIRVTDNRSGKLLELFDLEADRRRFERDGKADWPAIDRKRRDETRRLVDKHSKTRPRSAVSARWGRSDQVHEARAREAAVIMYEVRLARYLGLSLLATEIGTVETFNDDRLISSAGARGRYQMMPYLLRQHGINQYPLKTAAGNTMTVVEEWHPLLTLEPSFLTLRAYANAVGHEIPGISAYHTGPGNIFGLYRKFLQKPGAVAEGEGVVDAFIWGLTDGFSTVARGSSFGSYSRGYIPSIYGSLRATENSPIDTSKTMLAERVRLRPGRQINLRSLLHALNENRMHLHPAYQGAPSLYAVFREMNPHFPLPEGKAVPVRGDVVLVPSVQGRPVRFFLPLGASEALRAEGAGLLDDRETFRFDPSAFAVDGSQVTEWDRAYEELVRDIAGFGFTLQNRERLSTLRQRFEALARERPTHFRKSQLTIIDIHQQMWMSAPWDKLAEATRIHARR